MDERNYKDDVKSKIKRLEQFKKDYELQQKDIESRVQELELIRNERSRRGVFGSFLGTPISPLQKKHL